MKVRLRKGAVVYQDFRGKEWPFSGADADTVFTADPDEKGAWLSADGYGSFEKGHQYGNGKMHANDEDVIPVFDKLPLTTRDSQS